MNIQYIGNKELQKQENKLLASDIQTKENPT